jgi:hypothetical protein
MKKIFLITLLFTNIIYFCKGQDIDIEPQQEKEKKIEAIRTAFITKYLDLSPEEAQKFWPVHNKFVNEVKQAAKTHKDDALKREEAVLNVKKKYKPDFVSAIGEIKFNKFLNANQAFKKFLQNWLQERQRNPDRPRLRRKDVN